MASRWFGLFFPLLTTFILGCSNSNQSEGNNATKDGRTAESHAPELDGQDQVKVTGNQEPEGDTSIPTRPLPPVVFEERELQDILELSVDEYFSKVSSLQPGTRIRLSGTIREISSTAYSGERTNPKISGRLTLFFQDPNPVIGPTSLPIADRSELDGLHIEQEVTIETVIPDPKETQSGVILNRLGSKKESKPIWKVVSRGTPTPRFSDAHQAQPEANLLNHIKSLNQYKDRFEFDGWGPVETILLIEDEHLTEDGLLPQDLVDVASQSLIIEQVKLSCKITTGLIEQISTFPGIETLLLSPSDDENFEQHSMMNVDFSALQNMRRLSHLRILGGDGLNGNHLKEIGKIPFLRYLNFNFCSFDKGIIITDDWLAGISQSQTIRWIELPRNSSDVEYQFTEEGVRKLAQAEHLTSLKLDGIQITGECFSDFSNSKQLHTLDLSDCEVTTAGLQSLKSLGALKTLNISGCEKLNETSGQLIAELSELKSLTAYSSPIGQSFFEYCPGHPNLTRIDLSNTGLKPPTRQALTGKNWPALTYLDVGRNDGVGDDFGFVSNLPPNIRTVDFAETSITDAAIVHIVNQQLPSLKELILNDCQIGDASLRAIIDDPPPNLRSLLLGDTNCTEDTILLVLQSVPQIERILLPKDNVSRQAVSEWRKSFPKMQFY